MFNKEKFSQIIKSINDSYDSQHEFARISTINRTYLSKYINCKIDNPPKPSTLKIIAEASHGITTYEKLMEICGYTNTSSVYIDVYFEKDGNLIKEENSGYFIFDFNKNTILSQNKEYFAYQSKDDSMAPLLGEGDIAIIEKTNKYENGNTCLISLDNLTIFIRKILDFQDYIELHTAFSYAQPIKIMKNEFEKRNFTILGKVIKVENQSAFK